MKKPPIVIYKRQKKFKIKLEDGTVATVTPCPTRYANGFKPEATAKPHPSSKKAKIDYNSLVRPWL